MALDRFGMEKAPLCDVFDIACRKADCIFLDWAVCFASSFLDEAVEYSVRSTCVRPCRSTMSTRIVSSSTREPWRWSIGLGLRRYSLVITYLAKAAWEHVVVMILGKSKKDHSFEGAIPRLQVEYPGDRAPYAYMML